MGLRAKNIIYTLGLLSALFLVWYYRQHKTPQLQWLSGKTMGPITYNVKYFDAKNRNFQPAIDSLLQVFNRSLNTYLPYSEVSRFNDSSSFTFRSPYFFEALRVAQTIYQSTEGAFDPSVGPLINAWGFGPDVGFVPDSAYIDSVMQFVGFSKLTFDEAKVEKADARMRISFSASAKGYGTDVVAGYLEGENITDYFVEIGGEVRASGKNRSNGKPWAVGILHPDSDQVNQFPYAVAALTERAMATSGNYFNYHIIDGIKYGHTIDPKSGFPIAHNLLSATVFAPSCHEADALATAFMVMGLESTKKFLNKNEQYGAYLIYSTDNGDLASYRLNAGMIKEVE